MSEYRELVRQKLRAALQRLSDLQSQDEIDMTELDSALQAILSLRREIKTIDDGSK